MNCEFYTNIEIKFMTKIRGHSNIEVKHMTNIRVKKMNKE